MNKKNKIIAPSILSANFSKLGEEIQAIEKAGADWVHVDVMDGHFVPNITIGPLVVEAVKKVTNLPIDVHLMIENPGNYIPQFVKAGADYVSIHVEEGYHLDRNLNMIKELGAHPSVAINPATPLNSLEQILDITDMILLMTVNPGFGGQKFIGYCEDKIKKLRAMIDNHPRDIILEIDGGVKPDNIEKLSKLGTDAFVSGSAIFNSDDYQKTISLMKDKIN
jgi:ribulose-phosphate 3-epimerase